MNDAVNIGDFITAHTETDAYMRQQYATAISDAQRIIREAEEQHADGREIVARVILFSGGNDSTVLAHLMRGMATHAAHADTTVGIEATRQFVRDTCQTWGLPLIEKTPPRSYEDLVLNVWGGFPGPSGHGRAFSRLKERALRRVRKELVTDPRTQRVLFIAGRRRLESARRSTIVEHERQGSTIWASPLANWSSDDMRIYRALNPDAPRNPVAARLGMSGECLCGAFAEPGELDRIRDLDPDCAAWIDRLEQRALAAGHDPERCRWGWGAYRLDTRPATRGYLCTSCHDPALALLDPEEVMA